MAFAKRAFLPATLALTAFLLSGCGPNLFRRVGNFWSLSCCGVIIVLLDILALVELAGSTKPTGTKVMWALFIIFFPVGGCILYYLFGRS